MPKETVYNKLCTYTHRKLYQTLLKREFFGFFAFLYIFFFFVKFSSCFAPHYCAVVCISFEQPNIHIGWISFQCVCAPSLRSQNVVLMLVFKHFVHAGLLSGQWSLLNHSTGWMVGMHLYAYSHTHTRLVSKLSKSMLSCVVSRWFLLLFSSIPPENDTDESETENGRERARDSMRACGLRKFSVERVQC